MPDAAVFHREPDLLLADVDGVFVNCWTAPRVSLPLMEHLAEAQRAWAEGHGQRYAVLVLVDVGRAQGIDEDAKTLSVSHTRAMQERVIANAQVAMGGGLRGLAALGVMKAQTMLSNPIYPTTSMRDLAAATRWLAGHHPTVDAPALAQEAQRLFHGMERS
ncbi:MAG: hypothetical protein ACFCGT_27880 [Sandaracinaceae bacterium]